MCVLKAKPLWEITWNFDPGLLLIVPVRTPGTSYDPGNSVTHLCVLSVVKVIDLLDLTNGLTHRLC